MAKDMFWTTVTFSIIIGIMVLAFWPSNKGHVIVYDCRLAEGNINYPDAVKEECRKRSNK